MQNEQFGTTEVQPVRKHYKVTVTYNTSYNDWDNENVKDIPTEEVFNNVVGLDASGSFLLMAWSNDVTVAIPQSAIKKVHTTPM